jgi:PKHD-type hydroxylase
VAAAKKRPSSARAPTRRTTPKAEPPAEPAPKGLGSPRHILYRLWNGVLPVKVCEAVIEEFTEDDFYEAEIQRHDGSVAVEALMRDTRHVFIEPAHWTGSFVTHFAEQANLLWGLDLTGLGTLSILRYTTGSHFNWHVDVLAYEVSVYDQFPNHGPLERKLSITVNLSGSDEYEGGDLEFLNGVGQLYTQPELRERGSVVVFPSTVGHRVTPLTGGTRYALVGWMVGPPMR